MVREDAVDAAIAPTIDATLIPSEFRLKIFRGRGELVFQRSRNVNNVVLVLGSIFHESSFARCDNVEVAADYVSAIRPVSGHRTQETPFAPAVLRDVNVGSCEAALSPFEFNMQSPSAARDVQTRWPLEVLLETLFDNSDNPTNIVIRVAVAVPRVVREPLFEDQPVLNTAVAFSWKRMMSHFAASLRTRPIFLPAQRGLWQKRA